MAAGGAPTLAEVKAEATRSLRWRLSCPFGETAEGRRAALAEIDSLEPAEQWAFWAVQASGQPELAEPGPGRRLVQRWGLAMADSLLWLHHEALERAERAEAIALSVDYDQHDDEDEYDHLRRGAGAADAAFGVEPDGD
jgi:hypothetical protein